MDRPSPGEVIVPWYSIAKVFTAAAVHLSIDVDQPIGAVHGDLPPHLATLSVRDLLQHRSGLEDYGSWPDYQRAVASRRSPWPEEAILKRASVGARGEFCYSNIGYLLLRRMLEEYHRAPLFEVLQVMVLGPLGVRAQRFETRADWDRCRHTGIDDDLRAYDPGWVYTGTIAGDPQDAARGIARLMQGRLGAPLACEMRDSSRVAAPPEHPFMPDAGYGLGLMTGGDPVRVVGHGGGGPGFTVFAGSDADGRRWCGGVATEGSGVDPTTECVQFLNQPTTQGAVTSGREPEETELGP